MAPHKRSQSVEWYLPEMRGVIPIDQFRVSKNVRRLFRNGEYQYSVNQMFKDVIGGCAKRPSTWISPLIKRSYIALHHLGFAHSVEVKRQGKLVGGLYGVALGGAFFGESMFQLEPEVHKLALLFCHQRLIAGGFTLWDTQFYTDHLGTFGAIELDRKAYLTLLDEALKLSARF